MKTQPFLIITFLLFFVFTNSTAQNSYIPDDNFEQALIDLGYDTGALNDSIPTDSIVSILTLNINGKNISDVTGLQDFVAIENLYCSDNNIDTLNLSTFPNLFLLECFNNQIQHLNVSNNILLADIQCSVNNINQLNLENNPNLTSIKCGTNQIETIIFNSSCIAVELDCSYNKISNLNTEQLTELQYLDCSFNQITDLELSLNAQLIQLNCSDNLLTSLNIKNGNNSQLNSFSAINNPNLLCIQVDNADTAQGLNEWYNDDQTSYSEDCSNSDSTIPIL